MKKFWVPCLFLSFAAVFLAHSVIAGSGTNMSPYEEGLLIRINQYRIHKGLNPLSFDGALQQFAKDHCIYMERRNSLNHDAFHERFEKCGRSHCVENVGWNFRTPEDQLKAWKNSEGHNSNLLNRKIRFAGISKVSAFVTFFACD